MRPKYMRQVREAQEATRQKKLRDTPYGRDIDEGKTTAAQYKAAYGTAPGANEKLKAINKRASMVSGKKAAEGVLSNKSASVIPDDETASKIKAKRKKGTVYATARFKKAKSKKTGTTSKTLGSDVMTNPEEFEAEYQASGTGKAGDTFEAMKTTKKKRKKHTKRAARERFREAQKGKKPKTKKTTKTTKQKELEAAYGSPKDTERMMEHKNLKESKVKSILKKFRKG
jgi:hypothetical protein